MVSDNILNVVYRKKFIRGIISNYPYDHNLIRELNIYKKGHCTLRSLDILVSIYDNLKIKNDVSYDYILKLYKKLNFFLNSNLPSEDTITKILDCYYSNVHGYLFEFFLLLKNSVNLILDYSVFCILLNKKYYDSYKTIIILYSYDFEFLKRKSNDYFEYLTAINILIDRSRQISVKKRHYTITDIKNKVSKLSMDLISFLDVKQIRLFGSYYKKRCNDYSDIDFLIVTDSKKTDNDLTKVLLKKAFVELFDDNIDVKTIDVNYELDEFERAILLESKIIKIYGDIL